MNRRSPQPADIVVMAAGALLLLGSFLPFYEIVGDAQSAWSGFLFPLMTLPAFAGALLAVVTAIPFVSDRRRPDQVAGLPWRTFAIVVAIFVVVLMIGFVAGNPGVAITALNIEFVRFVVERGIGFWSMFVGAIGLFVGTMMNPDAG